MYILKDRNVIYFCPHCKKQIKKFKDVADTSRRELILLGTGIDQPWTEPNELVHKNCLLNNLPQKYRKLFEELKIRGKIIRPKKRYELFGLKLNGVKFYISYLKFKNGNIFFEGVGINVRGNPDFNKKLMLCSCGAELNKGPAIATTIIKKEFKKDIIVWDEIALFDSIKGCPKANLVIARGKNLYKEWEKVTKRFREIVYDYKKNPKKYEKIFPSYAG